MWPSLRVLTVALALSVPVGVLPAAADSDSDPKTPTCPQGYVYSPADGKCVKKGASFVPDRELKRQGWSLARAGKFAAAIELFDHVAGRAPADAEAFNGLGYSYRMAGDFDRGIAHYRRALAIDPDYLLARSYLAKGYLSIGLFARAHDQLREIGARCQAPCELYDDLAQVISRTKQGLTAAY